MDHARFILGLAILAAASCYVPVRTHCAPFLDVCDQEEPTTSFEIASPETFNTDADPRCSAVVLNVPGEDPTEVQAVGSPVCLVYATRVSIAPAGSLTVFGARPLAIASLSTMTVEGEIDVGSHDTQVGPAADHATCAFATAPEPDLGGGGGGAGGTFVLAGGDGGLGDHDDDAGMDGNAQPGTHGATVAITVLRGGCPGQGGGDEGPSGGGSGRRGGRGGDSGGALYLYAGQSIAIQGAIRATGARGEGGEAQSGGGGGGSGGLVVIEAPTIAIAGQISANGGGGGQGGGRVMANDIRGGSGGDGVLGTTPAAGGCCAGPIGVPPFSTGGAGGAGTGGAGGAGTMSDFAGGGGGGAAGVIILVGPAQVTGTISPVPECRTRSLEDRARASRGIEANRCD